MKLCLLIIGALVLFVLASYFLGYTPLLFGLLILCFSLASYSCYARDKRAAIAGRWRVPENRLHLLALIGGWPGALLAQQRLRHKTKKTSFRIIFWMTVLTNTAAIAWLHAQGGQSQLRHALHSIDAVVMRYVDLEVTTSLLLLTKLRGKP